MVPDPQFAENRWVYIFYSPYDDDRHNRVSRCRMGLDWKLQLETEVIVLTIPSDLANHQGGSLDFDQEGNMYITTGDDSQAGGGNGMQPGYSSMDERKEYATFDAQRSSSNTRDLEAKYSV